MTESRPDRCLFINATEPAPWNRKDNGYLRCLSKLTKFSSKTIPGSRKVKENNHQIMPILFWRDLFVTNKTSTFSRSGITGSATKMQYGLFKRCTVSSQYVNAFMGRRRKQQRQNLSAGALLSLLYQSFIIQTRPTHTQRTFTNGRSISYIRWQVWPGKGHEMYPGGTNRKNQPIKYDTYG